jgi:hypothetical protein
MDLNDAMMFLESTLQGFLQRNYQNSECENNDVLHTYLRRFEVFISDPQGYWIREKALDCIFFINEYEAEYVSGRIMKDSASKAIDKIIIQSRDRFINRTEQFRTENGKTTVFMDPPVIHPLESIV